MTWVAVVTLACACTSPNPDFDSFTAKPTSTGGSGLGKGDPCSIKKDSCADGLACCEAAVERNGVVDRETVCLPRDWCPDRRDDD
jgi:hypothetical protein